MKNVLLASTLLSAGIPALAQAATVYPGCAAPALKAGHHTFYVDPVNGSMKGDGSAAKPWHTLAEVLGSSSKLVATQSHKAGGTDPLANTNPNAPIQPGDVLMLKTGNHGDVVIFNNFNKDFITVMPAPGQAPVIQSLRITSSAKWAFQGLKFMPGVSKGRPGGIIAIGYGDWAGDTSDVVLDSNTISTADDTADWTGSDWMKNTQSYGVWSRVGTSCESVTNSHFYAVLNGISASTMNSVVQSNLIERIFNDGIDVGASDVIVKNNTIKSGTNTTANDVYHADGIQGFLTMHDGVVQVNRNVTIDGNIITKTGNANISYMQGITVFDGKWDNLTVQNNVVVTNHWNAMALYGLQNSKVVNNTVIASDPVGHPSWIQLRAAKDGTLPANTIVRNNISTELSVVGTNMQVDHNIAAKAISVPGMKGSATSGTVGNQNVINTSITSTFTTFDIANATFNMKPRQGSPAVGFGTPSAMPPVDVIGRARTAPVDLGAYVH